MTQKLLQYRINELDSGILNFIDDKVFVTGFYNAERLITFLEENIQNWSSKGVYNTEKITFNKIKDNALFIVQRDGLIIDKCQFIPVHKDVLKYKNKPNSVTATIRRNPFNNQYNFLTEKESILFESKRELNEFLENEFTVKIVDQF